MTDGDWISLANVSSSFGSNYDPHCEAECSDVVNSCYSSSGSDEEIEECVSSVEGDFASAVTQTANEQMSMSIKLGWVS